MHKRPMFLRAGPVIGVSPRSGQPKIVNYFSTPQLSLARNRKLLRKKKQSWFRLLAKLFFGMYKIVH